MQLISFIFALLPLFTFTFGLPTGQVSNITEDSLAARQAGQ
jgi:hypothetical protein